MSDADPATLPPQLSPQIAATLQQHIPILLSAVSRKINIAQLAAAFGNFTDIEVDKIVLGAAQIGQVTLNGTSADLRSASAYLRNVRIILELQFTLDWWYDLGFTSGSGTDNLGSLSFGIDVGDILVPSLNNIPLTIPNVTATNLSAAIDPITNLDLAGGGFTGLSATGVTVPADGFQLSGLGLGPVSVANVQVPRAVVQKVSIDDFKPNANITLPSVQVGPVEVPSANAGDIQTASPIAFDGIASRRGISASLGIFGVTIWVTPIAHISIGLLDLQDVSIEATVNQAVIKNVTVPVDVRGINLKAINVGQIEVNNVTL